MRRGLALDPSKRGTGFKLETGWNGTALERFLKYCRFDPGTGCVIWIGGTTTGRGHTSPYGSFWFEGRRWFAHRWSAKFIHKQEIDGLTVDHCCPHISYPNTLCVEHTQPRTVGENSALMHQRRKDLVEQTIDERRFWIHAQVGLIEAPPVFEGELFSEVPMFNPPAWLGSIQPVLDDCPF